MKTIAEIQNDIVNDFNEIGDPFDQYAYLIELSCAFVPMYKDMKTPELLVEGCQSHVWLYIYADENGKFQFDADSDTLIVKGILYLLQKCYCGKSPDEVEKSEIFFLDRTAIMDTFESDRQKGIGYVIKKLRYEAGKMRKTCT